MIDELRAADRRIMNEGLTLELLVVLLLYGSHDATGVMETWVRSTLTRRRWGGGLYGASGNAHSQERQEREYRRSGGGIARGRGWEERHLSRIMLLVCVGGGAAVRFSLRPTRA